MDRAGLKIVLCLLFVQLACANGPLVTLSHGGQLRGKTFSWEGVSVDLFLGVRYAKAPVGDYRFEKPQDVDAWSGEVDATAAGSICIQSAGVVGVVGDEDCLFMDITVPGGVQTQTLKPVMVWIHGGAFVVGTGTSYFGAPLAVTGDVIVVTFNYRLGLFGFLSNGNGTGNYGLWDQRKALQWVQANIAEFGGDPNNVTIFGESAGAGSVSAQVMSQRTSGLFHRAIQQSGTIYTPWGWFLSEKMRLGAESAIRQETCCEDLSMNVYQCLGELDADKIGVVQQSVDDKLAASIWKPTADDDFFASSINDEDYVFPNDVDLMIGFNGQEGLLELSLNFLYTYYAIGLHPTGVSMDAAKSSVESLCRMWNPGSMSTCYELLMDLYELDTAPDDVERAIRMSYAYGELGFNSDSVRKLRAHSSTSKSTYAYYFDDLIEIPDVYRDWTVPDGMRLSADHADELRFVFGAPTVNDVSALVTEYIDNWENGYDYDRAAKFWMGVTADHLTLGRTMMLAWTNFAKSGDPNTPEALPNGVPTWPEFSVANDQFMQLRVDTQAIITTPNKTRLDTLLTELYPVRTEEIPMLTGELSDDLCNKDNGASISTVIPSLLMTVVFKIITAL